MTPYAALKKLAGLSLREASNFHDVGVDTVKSWNSGRSQAPESAFAQLRELIQTQEECAKDALAAISAFPGSEAATIYVSSDAEAKQRGWPCQGAWFAFVGRVVVKSPIPVVFESKASSKFGVG